MKPPCERDCPRRTGIDVFHTWMENGVLPGQEVLEEFREDLI